MKIAVLALVALTGVTTLLALAVGVPPEQFGGPGWLRNSIAGRAVLLLANFLGSAILSSLL